MTIPKNKKHVDESVKTKYLLQSYLKIIQTLPEKESLISNNNPTYIADFELSELRYKFDSTQDPFSALSIFVKCVELGCYPPTEVLLYLNLKLKEYLDSDKSLDAIVGLNSTTKKANKRNARDMKIVSEIDTLRYYFNLQIPDAVDAVTKLFAKNGIHLSSTTIQDIYDRNGKRQINSSLKYMYDDISWVDEMSEEFRANWKKDYLSQYPSDVKEFLQKK